MVLVMVEEVTGVIAAMMAAVCLYYKCKIEMQFLEKLLYIFGDIYIMVCGHR